MFDGNTAGRFGGGLRKEGGEACTITTCFFGNNTCGTDGGGVYTNGATTLFDTVLCGNAPDHMYGPWTDSGGNCQAFTCQDDDDDGWPNECSTVGDGVHEVPGEYATIQEAIIASGPNDEILIGPGTYTGEGNSVVDSGGKNLWIHSSDRAAVTIIDGEGVRRVHKNLRLVFDPSQSIKRTFLARSTLSVSRKGETQ